VTNILNPQKWEGGGVFPDQLGQYQFLRLLRDIGIMYSSFSTWCRVATEKENFWTCLKQIRLEVVL
jgi:hypothetical protein